MPPQHPSNHRAVEILSLVLYRDVFLTLHPRAQLPPNLATLLQALDYEPTRHKTPEFLVTDIRAMLVRERTDPDTDAFCLDNINICLRVAELLYSRDNMQPHERDMRARWRRRLGCVKLLQKRDEESAKNVWALDLEEDVQEGLGQNAWGRELERRFLASLEED